MTAETSVWIFLPVFQDGLVNHFWPALLQLQSCWHLTYINSSGTSMQVTVGAIRAEVLNSMSTEGGYTCCWNHQAPEKKAGSGDGLLGPG